MDVLMVQIATASTPDFPRVFRDAASHMRALPVWSFHDIFWNSIHFASSAGSGSTFVILAAMGEL
jgi:hypothetical protein